MKKSIFLIFAAILCAMSVSAKVIYLKPNSNWTQANAAFWVHAWGGTGDIDLKMTPVANDPTIYEAEVGTSTSVIFLRRDSGKDGSNVWDCWNRMGNLAIPADKNCCTINNGEWTQEKDDASSHVTWSTYTPSTTAPDRYLTGTLAGGWNANDVLMTYDEANEIYTHTFTSVAADEEHKIKVTDGTWDANWGGDAVSPAIDGVTKDGDGNVVFTLSVGGDVTVTFDGSHIQLSTTGSFTHVETFDYYLVGSFNSWNTADANYGMTKDGDVYKKEVTFAAATEFKVCNGSWASAWGINNLGDVKYLELEGTDNIVMKEEKTFTVIFNPTENLITFDGLTAEAVVKYDYYLIGTINGWVTKDENFGMTDEDADGVYEKEVTLTANTKHELKINNGSWDDNTQIFGFDQLNVAYEGVSRGSGDGDNNVVIELTEDKTITVKFDKNAGKITLDGLTEKAPAADVTVYFINSGNWDEVACHYWGGLNGSTWPGVQMTANGEVFETEGWKVYAITFPGDNTKCIFNDNKAEGATQTADLEVQNGKYYCYENGIWYERLADVDPLDTRVYLKGDMNEWCTIEGWCDMFRKEDKSEQVAYRTVFLEEAGKTYEFKIESAGAWLSHAGAVTKDNCTDLIFEEGVSTNCTITTEYAGEYIFTWDMTNNKLSVEYPELVPEVMEFMVTNMVFDEDNMAFVGTDNMMGVEFNLVVGDPLEDGVFSLDASSTVNFGGTLFTDVTGMIAPDMDNFASASAIVYGFYMGMYFQLNVEMSAGGSAATLVEILDGTASVDDATSELTISATWEGDDVYVVVPGFNNESFECDEVWFYVGGTSWETASIIAFGPATITVEEGVVTVEGTVTSGMTGAQYELFVMGDLPVEEEPDPDPTPDPEPDPDPTPDPEPDPDPTPDPEETPDYTRTVTSGQWGTICLPYASSSFTGATFYEVSSLDTAKGLWLDQLAAGDQLEAGKPYIFQATATDTETTVTITVTYTDAAPVDGPQEGTNGLIGTFTGIAKDSVLVDNYIIAENKVWVAGANATLPANRAYINATSVPKKAQAVIPGRRRVCMGENATTGLDQIVAPAGQAVKVIENGQLIIIRDGVKYNVQGQVIR